MQDIENSKLQNELIFLAYECARREEAWPVFLDKLSKAVGANCAFLSERSGRSAKLAYRSESTPPGKTSSYDQYWAVRDPCIRPVNELARGFVTTNRRAASDFERTPFHNEYCKPAGRLEHLVINTYKVGRKRDQILIARQVGDQRYSDDELESVRFLVPHLLQASEISLDLQTQAKTIDALNAGLQANDAAIIVLDKTYSVQHLNPIALQLIESAETLKIVRNQIVGVNNETDRAIKRLLLKLQQKPGLHYASRVILYSNTSNVFFARASRAPIEKENTHYIVLTVQPLIARKLDHFELSELFGTTPRESEVITAITRGSSALELATDLQISENTVRWHIRNALDKLGVANLREAAFLMGYLSQSHPSPHQN